MTQIPVGLHGTLRPEYIAVSWDSLARYLLHAYGSSHHDPLLLDATDDAVYWVPMKPRNMEYSGNDAILEGFLKDGSIEAGALNYLVGTAQRDGHLPKVDVVIHLNS